MCARPWWLPRAGSGRNRWGLRADWGNGIVSGRSTARYRSDIEVTQPRWGGGWQSTLEVGGDVRLAARARMTVTWFTSGEGRLEDDSPH